MITLYPIDREEAQIRDACYVLQRAGYHVLRPEHLVHVGAQKAIDHMSLYRAPEHVKEMLLSDMLHSLANELLKANVVRMEDVSTNDDRKDLRAVFRAEMKVVLPVYIEGRPWFEQPLFNAIKRLGTPEEIFNGKPLDFLNDIN